MERGKHKVEVIKWLAEYPCNGRTYKICLVKIADTGDVYISLRLYNIQGKFIKQFMMEPAVAGDIGLGLLRHCPILPYTELVRRFPHFFHDKEAPC